MNVLPRSKTVNPLRCRGAVLLVVLGFIFLASVLTVALLETLTRQIRSAAAASARDDLRLDAYSAMQVAVATLAEIKEIDHKLTSPAQGWGNPVAYAPVTWPENMNVTIEVRDETGKLPLQTADRDLLHRLFEQLDVGFDDAEELIDAYLDWTDEDDLERLNGAEADYYERLDPPRLPPNEPIDSYEAFRYIKGFDELFFDEYGAPNALYERFVASTSLDNDSAVNINTASADVLALLAENGTLNERALEDLKSGRDGIVGTDDDDYVDSSDDLSGVGLRDEDGVGYKAEVFAVTVRVEQGEKQFQYDALLVDDGGAGGSSSRSSQDGDNGEDEQQADDSANAAEDGDPPERRRIKTGTLTQADLEEDERQVQADAGLITDVSVTSESRGTGIGEGDASNREGSTSGGGSSGGSEPEKPALGDFTVLDWSENG